MKKQVSLFLVFLMVFNFLSCTKSIVDDSNITGPRKPNQNESEVEDDTLYPPLEDEVNAQLPPKMEFMYLDANNNRSEEPTDKIAMQLNSDMASSFMMISEKTGVNQYTTYLSDTSSGAVISMVYENNANFPKRITIFSDGESLIGTTTAHRDYSEDFDILWNMDGETEAFEKIPLKNDIYNYDDIAGLSVNLNYQLKTTIISVRIWAAITQYVENSPATYGFWSKIKNAINKVVAAISAVVAVVVAVFFPPLIPVAGIYIAGVGGFICGTVSLLSALEPVEKGKEEIAKLPIPKNKVVIIKNIKEPNTTIRDGSYFNLDSSFNRFLYLEFTTTELTVNNCSIKLKMENEDENSYRRMYGYFKFLDTTTGKEIPFDHVYGFIDKDFNMPNTKIKKITVEKLFDISSSEKPIYIEFTTTDDNVMINDAVSKSIRIYLHK